MSIKAGTEPIYQMARTSNRRGRYTRNADLDGYGHGGKSGVLEFCVGGLRVISKIIDLPNKAPRGKTLIERMAYIERRSMGNKRATRSSTREH